MKNICERLLLNLLGILRSSMKRFQRNTQMEKPIFKMAKTITRSNTWTVNKNEWSKVHFYWYFGLFPETIFIMKSVYVLFTMLVKKRFQRNTLMEKPIFKMAKTITRSNTWTVNKNEWSKVHFYWYFGLFPETIFIMKNVYVLYTMLVKKRFQC